MKTRCPECGLLAEGFRCVRCNALKVVSCSGACSGCREACSSLELPALGSDQAAGGRRDMGS